MRPAHYYPRIRAAVRAHRAQFRPIWSRLNLQTRFNSNIPNNNQPVKPDTSSPSSKIPKPNGNGTPFFKSAGRLSGRTCMVTGGTSGIGFAIAERFLQEGAKRVILVGRSYPRLMKAASRLEQAAATPSSAAETGEEEGYGDDVATRSPEEDVAQSAKAKEVEERKDVSPGAVIAASERISLLVGDVSSAESWMRALEREMVTNFHLISLLFHIPM